ncbi:hypothetical protein Cus16_0577 [Curtobacterium sp. ER1/6]|nr:hypothetical protein Cus16_0577 [Curtobacterium sp. ER1/6]
MAPGEHLERGDVTVGRTGDERRVRGVLQGSSAAHRRLPSVERRPTGRSTPSMHRDGSARPSMVEGSGS